MKVGMILDKPFPPDPRVENEALALVEAGFEVSLFCLTYGNENAIENHGGIRVRRFKTNRWIYKLSALAYTIPLYSSILKKKIRSFLLEEQIQVIHVHDMRIGKAVVLANKNLKLPMVLDLHDNFPEVMKDYPHLQKFPGRFIISPEAWKKAELELISISDKVLTVSPQFVDDIKERTGLSDKDIVLVPNAVRKDFYTNFELQSDIVTSLNERFVLLYLGDTGLRRGLLTAIDSLVHIKDQIPEVLLVIVGSSSTDAVLAARVKEKALSEYVRFEGWRDVATFPSYISGAAIGISPLNRSKQHDLAYANKLFQYMSLELPLIVSNARAQEELVTRIGCGLVHKEKDAKDLADKVFQLYNNPEQRKELGRKGKEFIHNEWNWDITSNNLVKLYKELDS